MFMLNCVFCFLRFIFRESPLICFCFLRQCNLMLIHCVAAALVIIPIVLLSVPPPYVYLPSFSGRC